MSQQRLEDPSSPGERAVQAVRAAAEVAERQLGREQTLPLGRRPSEHRDDLKIAIRREGRSFDEVVQMADEVLGATPSSASPRFLNQLFGGREPAATFGEMITPLTNTSMYTYKVAGPQVLIEQELLAHMASKVGFEGGEGMFMPGGSLSNLTAMLIARNQTVADARNDGLDGTRLTVYTSELSHYSIPKSAGILGMGRNNVRHVAADRDGRMRADELRSAVTRDLEAGHRPVMINATAGTTVLGAFDPIREIAAVAREHGIWLNVDGALGGTFLLCGEVRHLLDGCELADSFVWDAHKMMGIPLTSSVILLRHKGLLARAYNESADYLFQADSDALNPGTRSIQCGRRNDALKLWLTWQHLGDDGFDRRIRRQLATTRRAVEIIDGDPELELLVRPQCLSVCFTVRGVDSAAVCERLDQEGLLKIGYGKVHGTQAIRLVCVNPDLSHADLEEIFGLIKQVAAQLRG